jgi:hypothetical protein
MIDISKSRYKYKTYQRMVAADGNYQYARRRLLVKAKRERRCSRCFYCYPRVPRKREELVCDVHAGWQVVTKPYGGCSDWRARL